MGKAECIISFCFFAQKITLYFVNCHEIIIYLVYLMERLRIVW